MGQYFWGAVILGLAFEVCSLEVILDPYAEIRGLPVGAVIVFEYETDCDPCIEVWDAETADYEAQTADFEMNRYLHSISAPYQFFR